MQLFLVVLEDSIKSDAVQGLNWLLSRRRNGHWVVTVPSNGKVDVSS
jgi:hypothetical protein